MSDKVMSGDYIVGNIVTHLALTRWAAGNDVLAGSTAVAFLDDSYSDISMCCSFNRITVLKHTENAQVIDEAGRGAGRVGGAEQALQDTASQEVAQDTIGLKLLLGVAARDITGAALTLGLGDGRGVGQLSAHDGSHGEGKGSGSDELHCEELYKGSEIMVNR